MESSSRWLRSQFSDHRLLLPGGRLRDPPPPLHPPGRKCLLPPRGVSFEPAPAPVRVCTASPQAVRPVGLQRPRPGRGRPLPPPRSPSQATSTASSGPKRPLARGPGAHGRPWSSCPSLLLTRSCPPKPWPPVWPESPLGDGTAWGGRWTTVATFSGKGGGVRESGRTGVPGRGHRTPRGCAAQASGEGAGLEVSYWEQGPEGRGTTRAGEKGAAARPGARVLGLGASAAGAAGRGRAGGRWGRPAGASGVRGPGAAGRPMGGGGWAARGADWLARAS